jgi:hypothetical protein
MTKVSYGTGQYDSHSHAGHGKKQKLLPPAVGEHYNRATPGARNAVVGPPEGAGHGKRGKGYNTEAHTETHHGTSGQAMGHKDDIKPMCYDTATHSEGRGALDGHGGPSKIMGHNHGTTNKAEHHPRMSNEAHKFKQPMTDGAHGYGHSGGQRQGMLRMSGHQQAHRIGKK